MGRVIETIVDIDLELFERARDALEKQRHRSVSRDEVVHWFNAEIVRMVGMLELDAKSPGGALARIVGGVIGQTLHDAARGWPTVPRDLKAPGRSPLTPDVHRDPQPDGPPCRCKQCWGTRL